MGLFPKIFATLCFVSLCVGLLSLKTRFRPFHPRFMLLGILGDLGLVVVLEITRGAVGTAVGGELSALQYGHIGSSLAACLIYVPVLVSGFRLWFGRSPNFGLRRWHKRMGVTAFVLRAIGFALMFSMPTKF